MKDIVKEYTNGEVTIVWKPDLCTHASFCWKELPAVFNPQKRPWVNAEGASTERIIEQIKRCPSGALSYYMNDQKQAMETKDKSQSSIEAEAVHNGPLLIKGDITIVRAGLKNENRPDGAAFCRCGKSKNQPFCDGSHMTNPFEK